MMTMRPYAMRWAKSGATFSAGAVALALLLAAPAAAQDQRNQPNTVQGFSQNRKDPINIESGSLELRDKEHTATFIDNVRLVQGDTTLECKILVVHYEEESAPAASGNTGRASPSGPPQAGQQQIKRLEAKGGVVLTQKDQTATGDNGEFDVKSNIMILTGNVVLTQGPNVVKGDRLWVDLNTNLSRVESRKSGDGRVNALFLPSSRDNNKPGAAPDGQGAPRSTGEPSRTHNASSERDKPKQAPARPLKVN